MLTFKIHRGMMHWRALHLYWRGRQRGYVGVDTQRSSYSKIVPAPALRLMVAFRGRERKAHMIIAPRWPRQAYGSLRYRVGLRLYKATSWYVRLLNDRLPH